MQKAGLSRVALTIAAALPLASVGGCAARRGTSGDPPHAYALATTRPNGRATVSFIDLATDVIKPVPASQPAEAPETEGRPPIEALLLYARAQDALHENNWSYAADFLNRALALDPHSYELHYMLGRAYRGAATHDARSIEEMREAAAIESDHLDVQVDLGRQHLAAGDREKGLARLLLATQTSQYRANAPRAAEVDLFLADALETLGYDRAALDRYEHLLSRVDDNGIGARGMPELAPPMVARLHVQTGDLYLRQGRPAEALTAYGHAAAGGLDDFDLQHRTVRTLVALHRDEEATQRAAAAVERFNATPQSVTLLRDACRATGHAEGARQALSALHARQPESRAILFALVDTLRGDGKPAEADRVLAVDAQRFPNDLQILRRQVSTREAAGDLREAARLLIEASARRPAITGELAGEWDRLLRPINHDRLNLSDLATLKVSSVAEAARQYALWQAAERWPRRAVARAARDAALKPVDGQRPFPPAFRARWTEIWEDADHSAAWKQDGVRQLIDQATRAGDASLAAELRGRSHMGGNADAIELAEAVKLAGPPTEVAPELQLALARALTAGKSASGDAALLWKLVANHPAFGPAYLDLYNGYTLSPHPDGGAARRVVDAWRAAEPLGLGWRLLEIRTQLEHDQLDVPRAVIGGLFEDYGDDPRVLITLKAVYLPARVYDPLLATMEQRLLQVPRSFNIAIELAGLYAAIQRPSDARRVLDAARSAAVAAGEPDVLCGLATAYSRMRQDAEAQDCLEQALRIEPLNATANNDLAYRWAEQGRNLDRAQAMTRAALAAEPENLSFADSLAWVLYKQGRFAPARRVLEEALQSAEMIRTDPTPLDHFGDMLYRLGDPEAAATYWARCARILAAPSAANATTDDMTDLGRTLHEKLRQIAAAQPVNVAPIAAEANPLPPAISQSSTQPVAPLGAP